MKSEKMPDAKVAVFNAPAGTRQARSDIGTAECVRTSDREAVGGSRFLQLGRRRSHHQPS